MKPILLLIGLSSTFLTVLGQDHQEEEPHKKSRGIYELIFSGINTYAVHDGHQAAAAELHFTYWFDHYWGAGFSYTRKINNINEVALLASCNPTTWLTLNVGPNIILPHENHGVKLGGYSEAEFNIRPNDWIHFGPVVGCTFGEELEFSTGFHLGFEF